MINLIDCNNCENINITEFQQNFRGTKDDHICKYYNKRIIHRCTSACTHETRIYPCYDCEKEQYRNYKERI